MIDAWVTTTARGKLVRQQVELGPLGAEEVEAQVAHCGLCHSNRSVRNNDWGLSRFRPYWGTKPSARWSKSGQRPKA
jgi:uncharacterized zinc-type alcohol dehydrogenase-like protein